MKTGWGILGATSSAEPPPDARLEVIEARAVIDLEIEKLRPKERKVVRLFYGFGLERSLTVAEIAEVMGLKPSTVSWILDEAVQALRLPGVVRRLKTAGVPEVYGVNG